jgi:hypothetical protein
MFWISFFTLTSWLWLDDGKYYILYLWVSCVLIDLFSLWFFLFVCVFQHSCQMSSCFRVCSTFTKSGCRIMGSLVFSFYSHLLTIVGWWEIFCLCLKAWLLSDNGLFCLSFSNDGSALLYPCFSHLNAGLMMGVLLVCHWVSCILISFSDDGSALPYSCFLFLN